MISLLKLFRIPSIYLTIVVALAPSMIVKFAWYQQLMDFVLTSTYLYTHDPHVPEVYDFIVVGGGSAGAAVAARLSEHFFVLLLEAGGDPHPLSYVPIANPVLLGQPIIDWEYTTATLNNSGFAFTDQRMPWPRGRGLGGCSNNNWMQYNRGNPNDFDAFVKAPENWANITGDSRWNYFNVLKYFKRLEDYHGHWENDVGQNYDIPILPEQFHGRGGPMRIEPMTYPPALKHWLAAAEELGFQTTSDPNAVQMQGFGPFDVTQKKGVRFSTYRGYIQPNQLNKNLQIRRYAYATKIHFDETMRAIGVSYLHHGVPKYASADKEIIISAGAINTPQLLMLSGIGPQDHLLEVGIKPLVDLPVGGNLQDHVSAIASFVMDAPISFIPDRDLSIGSIIDWLFTGNGVMRGETALGGYGFVSTQTATLDWPNIFYILQPTGNFRDFGKMQDLLGSYAFDFWEKWLKPTQPIDQHLVYVLLGRPNSRGYIKLADANPMSKPIIQPAYFSDPGDQDLETLIDGMEFLVKMYENTKSFQVAGARLNPVPMPGCENYIFKSRRYFECVIRTHPQTIFHPSCTAPMGKVGDGRAVVDSELRVIGVHGLRIADASVMPIITNANLNAPTIMIGEACGDMIKSSWLAARRKGKVTKKKPAGIKK